SYIFDRAVFWVEALAEMVETCSDDQLIKIASAMDGSEYATARVFQELGGELTQRLSKFLTTSKKTISVTMGRHNYLKAGDSLLVESRASGKPSLAANALLLIDEVITVEDVDRVLYKGRVR